MRYAAVRLGLRLSALVVDGFFAYPGKAATASAYASAAQKDGPSVYYRRGDVPATRALFDRESGRVQ